VDKNNHDPGKILDYKLFQNFKNKRFLIIAVLILLIAVVGGIYSIFILAERTASETVLATPDQVGSVPVDLAAAEIVEVLPQQKRNIENNYEQNRNNINPLMDPFAEPMRLTGVVIGGRGGAMAIIESNGISNIVSAGDYVDDLWAVYKIARGNVILRAYDLEVTLYLDQPPVTRTLY